MNTKWKMEIKQFNPIQSKMVVTSQMRSVGLLQQSIPFLVAILYIMVHFSMFSLINFVAVSTEKSSSLPTIILKTKHKQSNILSCITIKYIFLFIEIRYFIPPTINTHIDCSKNSKSVFGAFSKQQQGALKVCLSAFSVNHGNQCSE